MVIVAKGRTRTGWGRRRDDALAFVRGRGGRVRRGRDLVEHFLYRRHAARLWYRAGDCVRRGVWSSRRTTWGYLRRWLWAERR